MSTGPTGQQLLEKETGRRNIVVQLLRAILGLGISFLLSRIITDALFESTTIRASRLSIELFIFLAIAAVALTISSVVPIVRNMQLIAEVVEGQESRRRGHRLSQQFHRDVQHAFDMADTESELFDVAGDALSIAHDGPAEILVADASQAHIGQFVTSTSHSAPGCGVSTPGSCPAVRRGQTLNFDDPNGLAACPRLRERNLPDGMRATCVPITVLGSPTAVLHAVQETPIEDRALKLAKTKLEDAAVNFGARLGMIRAMTQSQLQADTDPLTGLLNRRATENRVRILRTDETPFAVAMADLDHFKHLNDTYGHDTGDRALRLFARVISATVRDLDIVSRHGGEEFVIILPGANVITASPVLHRVREQLADALSTAQLPSFTVSLGVADSTTSSDYQEILDVADQALLRAKADGRDRLVVGESAAYDIDDLEDLNAGN